MKAPRKENTSHRKYIYWKLDVTMFYISNFFFVKAMKIFSRELT